MSLISSIPESYREGVKQLAYLDEEFFKELNQALDIVPPAPSISELLIKIDTKKGIDKREELEEIFLSVASLIPLIDNEEELQIIVEDIVQLSLEYDLIGVDRKEILGNRLRVLFASKSILQSSKAEALTNEYGNVFLTCRVMTDIRPIFELNLEEPPKAAIVRHNLHIHYQADLGGDHKDLFISLDSRDLNVLINALIRADEKEKTLQLMLDKIGMRNIKE